MFEEIILANGSVPRTIELEGINHTMVCGYTDFIQGKINPGKSIAIIGAGGIAIDTALFILHGSKPQKIADFANQWGIDTTLQSRGGLLPSLPPAASQRKIFMLQRASRKIGSSLGKTTGWIHRLELSKAGVEVISEVIYKRIHDGGIDIEHKGMHRTLPVDQVIICAGQQVDDQLYAELSNSGRPIHRIGGALRAEELNAHRAIEEGTLLGLTL